MKIAKISPLEHEQRQGWTKNEFLDVSSGSFFDFILVTDRRSKSGT